MKTVAILASKSVIPYDLGIACDVFSRVKLPNGEAGYRVRVCAESDRVAAGSFEICTQWRLRELSSAEIVIVPGIEDVHAPFSPSALRAVQRAHEKGALVASICSGAFLLAAAGLLDSRRATTHWAATAELKRRHPEVDVDADVLFVDSGDVVTSAGASAGLDMCLYLVRRHYGEAVAAHSARLAVAPLYRDGGQAQFIQQHAPAGNGTLAPLIDWMLRNLDQRLDVATLAARACMSPRTFARRFVEQVGSTPVQWLLRMRVRRAQELLETSAASIEKIASATGFESPITFRARFHRVVGLPPTVYRRRFKMNAAPNPTA
ncbi:GlxA family transcriptional regulator [Roseateles sp.]|uniref:GlxA family transcriptional regulator n=1 Tax=Roseateles sp. TaxID=1971397 RepID=UPI0039EAEE7D